MTSDLVTYLRALAEKHPWTVRSAARMRQPLDGADAQTLEGALCSTERERDEARAEVERLRGALTMAAGYVRYCHDAWHEARDLAEAWRDLTKIREVLNDERAGELEAKP